jgi:hypothetical protein
MAALIVLFASVHAFAAVGCTLNDPDRDIRRLFPEATNFKTEFISIKEKGGDKLTAEIEKKLGDKLDKVYETQEVPYAYYTVLKGADVIGWVHGINQKGRFGGMQIILASDTNGIILDFYYQKLSSPESKRFRNKEFTKKFKGLTLADFYEFKKLPEAERGESKVGVIGDPSKKSNQDFQATLRGIMKNLILLDVFKLDRKYDKKGEEHDEKEQ